MIAYIVVALVLVIGLYVWSTQQGEKKPVDVKPPTSDPTAPVNITPPPPPVPLPTPNVVVSKVVDPDGFEVANNQNVLEVLKDNSAAWNPIPPNNGDTRLAMNRMFRLCFQFAEPVNIATVSVSFWGDTTHDAKSLKVFKDCSYADAALVKAYDTKTGVADTQTFSLPETLVDVKEIALGFVAQSEWQILVRRVKFN